MEGVGGRGVADGGAQGLGVLQVVDDRAPAAVRAAGRSRANGLSTCDKKGFLTYIGMFTQISF